MTALGQLRKSLLGISETAFKDVASQRVPEEDVNRLWPRFGSVPHALTEGYHAVLEDSRFEVLVPRLNAVESELRGFAYEGAGMGLALLDGLMPWKKHLEAFVDGPGSAYISLLYIGAGLALARLRRRPERLLTRLDPMLCWWVLDGYGFHEGFFAWDRYIEGRAIPVHLSRYACRIFDQGMGRSLWFSVGADVERIAGTIANFPSARQVDLWSGIGLACAYAGRVDRATVEAVWTAAGPYKSQLARGAAVAAKARQQAGNMVPHTELACEIFCGLSSEMAAHMTDVALENLPTDSVEPIHEIWQQRIEAQFAGDTSRHLHNS